MPLTLVSPSRSYEVISPREAQDRAVLDLLRDSPEMQRILAERDVAAGAEREQIAAALRDLDERDAADRPALQAAAEKAVADATVIARAARNAARLAETAAAELDQHDDAVYRSRETLQSRLRRSAPTEVGDAHRRLRDEADKVRAEFRGWDEPTGECDLASGARIMAHHSNADEIASRVAVLNAAREELDGLVLLPESPATIRRQVAEILQSVGLSLENPEVE